MHVVRREAIFPNCLGECILATGVVDEPVFDLVEQTVAPVTLIILIEPGGVIENNLNWSRARRTAPDDRALSERHLPDPVESAIKPLLVIMQVVGIVIDARSSLHLADPQHFARIYRDSLAGDRCDHNFITYRTIVRCINFADTGLPRFERSPAGEKVARVLNHSRIQDGLTGFADHARVDNSVDQSQMICVDRKLHTCTSRRRIPPPKLARCLWIRYHPSRKRPSA